MSDESPNLFDAIGLWEDSPAKTYRWLDDVLVFLEAAADCGSSSKGAFGLFFPPGFSLKTSLDYFRQTKDGTSERSPIPWRNWGIGGPTGFLTLNGSEFPNDAAACSLSDVLETSDVPPKYFLSAKACRGILRRAEKRGKKLPLQLRMALEAAATDMSTTERIS